jgi:hypothetical protein
MKTQKQFRAYHINAEEQTITEIMIPDKGSLEALQKCVGGYIEPAVRFENEDILYVNEEGLFCSPQFFFIVKGAHQPFAGNGVMIGTDDEGDNQDVQTSLDDIKKQVRFADKQTLQLIFALTKGEK